MTSPPPIDERLAARILACPGLPTLPAVAVRVLQLCEEDEVDLAAIAHEVSHDPAISAKLLRLANSASFATRGKVASLTRAVALLGTNATLAIALSFSLIGGRRRTDASGFDHPAFWKRALFAAIAGRALARPGEPEEDDGFVACLLQDIGMLAMNEVFPRDYGQLSLAAQGDHDALTALEREALEVDHVQVGHLLARRWNLPDRFQEAILRSHDPGPRPDPAGSLTLYDVVYLSGRLADVWSSARPLEACRAALDAAGQRLGLPPPVVPTALQRMAASVPEAAADFDLELGGPDRVQEVLDEAQRLLAAHRPSGGLPEPEAPPVLDLATFEKLLEAEVDRARRSGRPMALLATRAPAPGPGEQAALARLLRGSLRQTDLMAFEGDLYLSLLVDTPDRGALVVAERVRARLAAAGTPFPVGVACAHDPATASAEALLSSAFTALRAEAQGAPP